MENEQDNRQEELRRQQALKRRRELRRKKARRQKIKRLVIQAVLAIVILVIGILIGKKIFSKVKDAASVLNTQTQGLSEADYENHPEWTEDFLTENRFSRPGTALKKVDNIFIHYVANPGTTAKQNRDYFQNLSITQERNASAHFIIGLEGEIIQCVPLDEIAYAVKEHNDSSISIECCHPEEDGRFSDATYQSLLELLRWLMDVYDLEKENILRHYDSNGKMCPIYYVEHEDAWEQLKKDI